MSCLLIGIALLVPRIVLFFIWLLTHWIKAAFDGWLLPLLGFLLMPYTTLAYMATMLNNNHAVSGGWWALIIIAAIVDVSHCGSGHAARRRRRRRL